ncbi:serine/threonine-protein kinase [Streptomyces indiaensis]|uniref:non-specific serine/threonine protein kinase n=1 Tax=Streptomyces indiaensis TaxID=284033 RepID=A0ABN3E4M3_9ACTN
MGLREVRGIRALRGCARILAGRYRLDALIGSGGAADVYRGFDLRLQRPVAVKLFRPGTGFDTEEAFRSEAVILARLQHPGLVTAFDAGRHDGEAFLVMELIDGRTLKARIAEGPLSWEAAAALGAALAEALAHAHQEGIVHRDVKPSNIILDSADHPHLTDFGISRLLDATTHTSTDALTGTAAYLSPEQVLGRPVGTPADIYALGLVLLECLTGRLEYDGGPLEAAIARLHRPPTLPDFLPDGFATLLRDMTSLEEQVRPTAYVCAQALTRLPATSAASSAGADVRPALSIVPRTAVTPRTDHTHRAVPTAAKMPGNPSATTGRPEGILRSASPRTRVRTRGVAAALAALLASGLVVTDGFSHQDAKDEAAPSVPDAAVPPTSPDPADHEKTTAPRPSPNRSVSGEPLSASDPIQAVHTPSDSSRDGNHPSTAGHAERTAAKAATKKKPHKQPPGHARKKQKGGKAALHK